MGKNLIQQKRGKGSPTYRVPSFRFKGRAKHNPRNEKTITGVVDDIIKCQAHSSPLIKINYENGQKALLIAPEGIKIGDSLTTGPEATISTGNTVALKNIPEGTSIYNIESIPGDGGKFVRASGTSARIITKMPNKIVVRLPSNKNKEFNPECRACIGITAGSGRLEKPFLKAGRKYHKMRARNKLYPKVCGISMNALTHPFGGSSSHIKGRPTQSPRNAPPGRKVGKIAPRRTGRGKK